MGNKIASELVSALRLSTLGTTLCSRTKDDSPAMVDIRNFPGVAKAVVKFFGDYTTPNTSCQIVRSFNVSSVTFLGKGQYKINLNNDFSLTYNLGADYIITGSVITHTDNITAANTFFTQNDSNNSVTQTITSFRIFTTHTSTSGISAANARYVNLAIF